MKTNIVVDDELLEEALRCSGLKTKREVVVESPGSDKCFLSSTCSQ